MMKQLTAYSILAVVLLSLTRVVAQEELAPVAGKEEPPPPASVPTSEESDLPDRQSKLSSPRLNPRLRGDGAKGEVTGFYLAAHGDLVFAGNAEVNYANRIGATNSFFTGDGESQFSYGGGGRIGYIHYSKEKAFDEFQIVPAIELEGSYMTLEQELNAEGAGAGTNIDAEFTMVAITANATVRFHNKYLTPYLGFGGGLAYLSLDGASGTLVAPGGTTQVSGSGTGETDQFVPIFQGIVGLERIILYPNLSVFVEYKPFYIPDGDFSLGLATANRSSTLQYADWFQHRMQLGLRWTF